MAAPNQRQITVFGDVDHVGTDAAYDLVERHADGGLALVPRSVGENTAGQIQELLEFAGMLRTGGQLRRDVDALRDEWPS